MSFRRPYLSFFHGFWGLMVSKIPGKPNKNPPWQGCSRKARKVQGLGVKTARSNRLALQNVANFQSLAAHGNSRPPDPCCAGMVLPKRLGGWCEMEVPESVSFLFCSFKSDPTNRKAVCERATCIFAKRIVCCCPKLHSSSFFLVHSCHCCQYFEQWKAARCTTCRTTTQWRACFFWQFSNSKELFINPWNFKHVSFWLHGYLQASLTH